ncbi:beta-lactamase domain-containing protein [Rhodomicrobium vannielii ATCC 17100]|uniref:Beta-lactamase domain-containing protein n=1 Tax=Rhodomicrobium vannielii (strain ATCC 17100 / DSM 162 / LMG 4299 / NCIMB 10020 / ATH 3.1.1) TaxID=648757 RepID=E3I7U0_RHOVT|nr:MBL fold metallo-hydrolase [Rhodomicrobium vannielii]ADP70794.1 beta-lactamase domain-containing protein [Rhodomicrobium vannielii ATCC 17100]
MTNPNHKTPSFSREMPFEYGKLEQIAPGVRRIVCENPGPFTFKGTNLYVVGEGDVAAIDPGPAGGAQVDLLLDALRQTGERVAHIILTHCHADHSGAAAALKKRTGAPTYGMARKIDDPVIGKRGPSGGDFVIPVAFDVPLHHGDTVRDASFELHAVHTPGHAPDHLCFRLADGDILFSGDTVMGWNTSVVAPPEGNMGDYLRSLDMLIGRNDAVYFPAHGGPVHEPQRFVKALIFHRRWRELEVLEALRAGATRIGDMVPRIYNGLEPALVPAAALSVFATLEHLVEKQLVAATRPGSLDMAQEFALLA